VVVPDFFFGDPFNPENADRPVPVWIKDHGTVGSYLQSGGLYNCSLFCILKQIPFSFVLLKLNFWLC